MTTVEVNAETHFFNKSLFFALKTKDFPLITFKRKHGPPGTILILYLYLYLFDLN